MRLLWALVLATFLTPAGIAGESFSGKVVAISDGDTIRVMHNGRAERIRLWGIDCPEKRQPFGTRATQTDSGCAPGTARPCWTRKSASILRSFSAIPPGPLPAGGQIDAEV